MAKVLAAQPVKRRRWSRVLFVFVEPVVFAACVADGCDNGFLKKVQPM